MSLFLYPSPKYFLKSLVRLGFPAKRCLQPLGSDSQAFASQSLHAVVQMGTEFKLPICRTFAVGGTLIFAHRVPRKVCFPFCPRGRFPISPFPVPSALMRQEFSFQRQASQGHLSPCSLEIPSLNSCLFAGHGRSPAFVLECSGRHAAANGGL